MISVKVIVARATCLFSLIGEVAFSAAAMPLSILAWTSGGSGKGFSCFFCVGQSEPYFSP